MEGTIEQPVAKAFMMLDFGNFKVMMKTVCFDLWTEDLLGCTKCCAVPQRSLAKERQEFYLERGFVIPTHSKIGQGMRNLF